MKVLISLWVCFILIVASTTFLTTKENSQAERNLVEYNSVNSSIPRISSNISPQVSSQMSGIFTLNQGQVGGDNILYYSTSSSGGIAFSSNSIMITTIDNDAPSPKGNSINFTFIESNDVTPVGENPAPWFNNYFIGNDSNQWRTDVPNFRTVVYENLWDGIDLVYYYHNGYFKYDYIVHPMADYHQICVLVEGHQGLCATEGKTLEIITGLGQDATIFDTDLDVFYADDEDDKLQARFSLSNNIYSFDLLNRDPSRTVIIDPLIYSTFLGGASVDMCLDVTIDSSGYSYMTGYTNSAAFPSTAGSYDPAYNGDDDVFVSKVSPNGNSLAYSTFIGGTGEDQCKSITVDNLGYAYLAGYTGSIAFPTTGGAFDTIINYWDGFVIKLSQSGNSLIYSTFLGGTDSDYAEGIAVDTNGSAYVTGRTASSDYPITAEAFDDTGYIYDAFVTKFNPTGNSLVYSSYLGGSGADFGESIAVDTGGYAYVTGETTSADFPTTTGAFDTSPNGNFDAFSCKINQNGSSLIYSTYIGGSTEDWSHDIAFDSSGCSYLVGNTPSSNFPTTTGAFDTTYNGVADIFVCKLNSTGGSLLYSTFLGGDQIEWGASIVVDNNGCAHVTGRTASASYPVTAQAFDKSYNEVSDVIMSSLSSDGSALIYSTFIGGNDFDAGFGLAVDSDRCVYIAGRASSADFPTTAGAYDITHNGGSDLFLCKLDPISPTANAGTDQSVGEGATVTFDGSGSTDNLVIVNYTWTLNDGGQQTLYGVNPNYTFIAPGVYNVTLNVTDSYGNYGLDWVIIIVNDITNPVANAGPDQMVDEDTTVTFDASGSMDNIGIANYTWTFMDGVPRMMFDVSPVYIFNTPGLFNVTLNVSDVAGNYDLDWVEVTVNDSTNPVADAGANQTVDEDTNVQFDASGSIDNYGIDNYTWAFVDNGTQVLYGISPDYMFNTSGIYAITLNVTDNAGNWDTDWTWITVIDATNPIANAGPDQSADEDTTVTFDASGSMDNIGIANYTWTFMDEVQIYLYGMSPSYIFNTPGLYNVTLNVTDLIGNYDEDCVYITVNDITVPVITLISPANNSVIPALVILDFEVDDLFLNIVNYSVNGSPSTSLNPPFNIDPSGWIDGIYSINIYANDLAGNEINRTYTFEIDSSPPDIDLVSPSNNTQIQGGTIIDIVVSDVNILSVNYSINAGLSQILNSPYDILTNGWGDGIYIFQVYAVDIAGNIGLAIYQFILDSSPPTIVLNRPANNSVLMPGTILNFSVSDPHLNLVNYSVNGGIVTLLPPSYDISTTGWVDGTYAIEISALDNAENEVSVLYSFTIDSAQPESNLTEITLYWNDHTPIPIKGLANDTYEVKNVTLWFRFSSNNITWDSWRPFDIDILALWSWSFNFPSGQGYYEFYSIANDTAGNMEFAPMFADSLCAYDASSPDADAGPDMAVYEGTIVSFDASASTDHYNIVNYSWAFTVNGSPVSLCGVSPSLNFTLVGNYTVTLTVRDAAGNSDTDTMVVSVATSQSLDTDGDGIPDSEDVFPSDPDEWLDTDDDGTGNNADNDDDGDGYLDTWETFLGTDTLDPTDYLTDTDSDGIPDGDAANSQPWMDSDDDGDGVPDDIDLDPLDPDIGEIADDTEVPGDNLFGNYLWIIFILIIAGVLGAVIILARKRQPEVEEALETEQCPKCGFDIEKGSECPFCTDESSK